MLLIVNVQPLYRTSDLQNFSQDSFWLGSFLWITAMATPPWTTAGHDRDDRHFDPERPRLHEREDTSMTVDDLDLQLTTSRQLTAMTRWRLKRWLWTRPQLLGLATPLVADNTSRFLYRSVQRILLNTLVESPSVVTSKWRLIFTSADNISSKSTFSWSI